MYILTEKREENTMKAKKKTGLFSKRFMNSRITSANTQKSEMWLGYFAGPCLLYMVYYSVAGTYLTQLYTDVLPKLITVLILFLDLMLQKHRFSEKKILLPSVLP